MIRESLLALTLMGGAEFADLHTTQQALMRPDIHEANWMMAGDVRGKKAIYLAAEMGAFTLLRKKHKKLAWGLVGLVVVTRGVVAIHNHRLAR